MVSVAVISHRKDAGCGRTEIQPHENHGQHVLNRHIRYRVYEVSHKKSMKGPVFMYQDNLSTYCDSNNENMPGVIYIWWIVIEVRLDFYIETAPLAHNLDRGIDSQMVFFQEPSIVSYRTASWQSGPKDPSTYDQSTLLPHPKNSSRRWNCAYYIFHQHVEHAWAFEFETLFWISGEILQKISEILQYYKLQFPEFSPRSKCVVYLFKLMGLFSINRIVSRPSYLDNENPHTYEDGVYFKTGPMLPLHLV